MERFYVRVSVWSFLAVSTMVGMAFEYSHLENHNGSKRVYIPQLLLQLLIRGYTSVFTLMEYRAKSQSTGTWEDEADDEAKDGIDEEPDKRYLHQLLYFSINTTMNAIIGCWFYFLSGENICSFLFENTGTRRLFWTIIVVTGAPLSFLLTMMMKKYQKAFTQLGNKAIEALSFYVRLKLEGIERGTEQYKENLQRIFEVFKELSDEEQIKVLNAINWNMESAKYKDLCDKLFSQPEVMVERPRSLPIKFGISEDGRRAPSRRF